MAIPTPPVGARVRHTSTYPDGTAVTVEGVVTPCFDGTAPPHVVIGRDRYLFLVDQPAFTVALEVLELPVPPEPPNGTVYGNGMAVWFRCDNPDDPGDEDEAGLWWCPGSHPAHRWAHVAPIVTEPGWRRYIPDPADDAPNLPWRDGEDETEDKVYASGRSVYICITPGYVRPEEAELRAAAILRAAREARQP